MPYIPWHVTDSITQKISLTRSILMNQPPSYKTKNKAQRSFTIDTAQDSQSAREVWSRARHVLDTGGVYLFYERQFVRASAFYKRDARGPLDGINDINDLPSGSSPHFRYYSSWGKPVITMCGPPTLASRTPAMKHVILITPLLRSNYLLSRGSPSTLLRPITLLLPYS